MIIRYMYRYIIHSMLRLKGKYTTVYVCMYKIVRYACVLKVYICSIQYDIVYVLQGTIQYSICIYK